VINRPASRQRTRTRTPTPIVFWVCVARFVAPLEGQVAPAFGAARRDTDGVAALDAAALPESPESTRREGAREQQNGQPKQSGVPGKPDQMGRSGKTRPATRTPARNVLCGVKALSVWYHIKTRGQPHASANRLSYGSVRDSYSGNGTPNPVHAGTSSVAVVSDEWTPTNR